MTTPRQGFEYVPSTLRLWELLLPPGYYGEPRYEAEAADPCAVDIALTAWENALYEKLPPEEFQHGIWPSSPELVAALRAALRDHPSDYAGPRLAYTLARCGHRDQETMAALDAWDALLFRWQAMRLTANAVLEKFRAVGAAGNPTEQDLARLDRWIADPGAALKGGPGGTLDTLFNGRLFVWSLYHNGDWPEYESFLTDAATHCVPPLPIEDVTKECRNDAGADAVVWTIRYSLAGRSQTLQVDAQAPGWVNDAGLALGIEDILGALGRPDRVIRFGGGRALEPSFQGAYIVADLQPFRAVCRELGLPLAAQDDSGVDAKRGYQWRSGEAVFQPLDNP